jgi:hypothetical protein
MVSAQSVHYITTLSPGVACPSLESEPVLYVVCSKRRPPPLLLPGVLLGAATTIGAQRLLRWMSSLTWVQQLMDAFDIGPDPWGSSNSGGTAQAPRGSGVRSQQALLGSAVGLRDDHQDHLSRASSPTGSGE